MFELVEEEAILEKRCLGCGKRLPRLKQQNNALFCDTSCRTGQYSATSVGGMAEVLAARDLIRQGYWVYRALQANAPCDLIAQRGGDLFRVEVKAAGQDGSGSPADFSKCEVKATVAANGRVRYRAQVWE